MTIYFSVDAMTHLMWLRAGKEKHGDIAGKSTNCFFAMEMLSGIENYHDSLKYVFFLMRRLFMSLAKLKSAIIEFRDKKIPMLHR